MLPLKSTLKRGLKAIISLALFKVLLLLILFSLTDCTSSFDWDPNVSTENSINEFVESIEFHQKNLRSVYQKKEFQINNYDKLSNTEKRNLENELNDAIRPLILESEKLFLSLGHTRAELNDILDGNDPKYLIFMSYSLVEAYHQINESNNFELSAILGIQQSYAQTWAEIGGCASAALGLDIIRDMKEYLRDKTFDKKQRNKLLKKAFKKALTKVGLNLTGWGLTFTIAEFGICIAALQIGKR